MLAALAGLAIMLTVTPVRVIVHVPLEVPRASAGATVPWYCTPAMAHDDVALPLALLSRYERTLARYGPVRDRFGFGTWTVGGGHDPGVAFEADVHLDATMPLRDARAVVLPLLRELRAELRQREALAEIVGVAGPPGEARTSVAVIVPYARADVATVARLHRIFGDHGAGGASQYDDERGVHVYSGVTHAAAPRIEAELRRAGFRYTTEPETFVTVDAPPC